jgi:hypothetical protein
VNEGGVCTLHANIVFSRAYTIYLACPKEGRSGTSFTSSCSKSLVYLVLNLFAHHPAWGSWCVCLSTRDVFFSSSCTFYVEGLGCGGRGRRGREERVRLGGGKMGEKTAKVRDDE